MEKEVSLKLSEKLRLRKKKWLVTSLSNVLRGVDTKMEWQVVPDDGGKMVK